ncbi:unnamed protein product [Symbiodinium sp. CCMP2456]|nr:unnamed protein product [Symbiodinium sp. CCMP2456]
MYLCQPASDRFAQSCVAELAFEDLPFRPLRSTPLDLWRHKDMRRSTPHHLVIAAELILLVILLALPLIGLAAGLEGLRLFQQPSANCLQASDLLKELKVPGTFRLTHHVHLCEDANSELPAEELEAGAEIRILQLRVIDRSSWLTAARALDWQELQQRLRGIHPQALWAQMELDGQKGWAKIFDEVEVESYVAGSDRQVASFEVHHALKPAPVAFAKHTLTLSTAYVSTQWFLERSFLLFFGVNVFLLMAVGVCATHLLVLAQLEESFQLWLRHEQALEHRKLLRLSTSRWKWGLFQCLSSVISLSLVLAIAGTGQLESLSFIGFLGSMYLHRNSMRGSVEELSKWRQPQLSTECLVLISDQWPATSDAPATLSRARSVKSAAARYLSTIFAVFALAVLSMALLDSLQMSGEVAHMEFSRGLLVYPFDADAFHSTMLLDDKADSFTLQLQRGLHTKAVIVDVHHPLLRSESSGPLPAQENQSIEYEIPLPPGPLYAQISILAMGSLMNSVYLVHIVRIGTAANISLEGTFDKEQYSDSQTIAFGETRRLLYQLQNPVWYLPDLNVEGMLTFRVHLRPVCFAPLKHFSDGRWEGAAWAKSCECGNELAGFGDACYFRQRMKVGNESVCVFIRRARPHIHVQEGAAGVGDPNGALIPWLRDTSISGKLVKLAVTANGKQPRSHELTAQATAHLSSIDNMFRASVEAEILLQDATLQLLISSTQDETDVESQDVPLVLKSHPPPIYLKAAGQGFFLPPLQNQIQRESNYAFCGQYSRTADLLWTVLDDRFEVSVAPEQNNEKDCQAKFPEIQQLRAVRRQTAQCAPWCSRYRPWAEDYDLRVVHSNSRCLTAAVQLFNTSAVLLLENTTLDSFSRKRCLDNLDVLGQMLFHNQSLTKKLLDKTPVEQAAPDPNREYRGQRLLQVAVTKNSLENLDILLGSTSIMVDLPNKDQENALLTAGRLCRLRAMQKLLNHKVNKANASFENEIQPDKKGLKGCNATVLSSTLTEYVASRGACGEDGRRVLEAGKLLVDHGATYNTSRCDYRGYIMDDAIKSRRLAAMETVLATGWNSNTLISPRKKPKRSAFAKLLLLNWQDKRTRSFVAEAAQLLAQRGADVDAYVIRKQTGLAKAAEECNGDLIALLLRLGANSTKKDSDGKDALSYARECSDSNITEIFEKSL